MTKHICTPIRERLMRRVKIEKNGCWLWMGWREKNGYGRIMLGRQSDGRDSVHRVSWRLHHGDIPTGLFVLHRCDVRNCVNPDHLFLGTHQDNMSDCHAKGRRRGRPPTLSDKQVLDIFRHPHTTAAKVLAQRYGVSTKTIYLIRWQRHSRLKRLLRSGDYSPSNRSNSARPNT